MKGVPLTKFVPGIIWFFVVLILITLPGSGFPKVDNWYHKWYVDKWIHAGIFGLLAFLFMFPFVKAISDREKAAFFCRNIAILTTAWGFATECIQLMVPGRSFDWVDGLADAIGALLVYLYFRKKTVHTTV